MTAFTYKNGELHAEDIALSAIAADVGTPTYVYSVAAMTEAYQRFVEAFAGQRAQVCYAMKANSNLAVLRTFADLGAGADVVSDGELARALAAGIPATRIVYSGVGKTRAELAAGINAGILQFNVESLPELAALSEVAVSKSAEVEIAIRVNPDVDASTHHKISTGRKEDKFGIDIAQAGEAFAFAASLPGVTPVSIAVHIGSQLTDIQPFRTAFGHVAELTRQLRADGVAISRLDLGGGLGIAYDGEDVPTPAEYAAMVADTVGDLDCDLIFEPGRYLTGHAGVLLTRIIFVKNTGERRFVIVDAAMNDLMRPALYGAAHAIQQVREPASGATLREAGATLREADIVGPVCETGDTFATAHALRDLPAGELLVIRDTGAYGAVMSSGYNSRPLVPEVLVNGGDYAVVRPRETLEQQLDRERFASWQSQERTGQS
ncbi:MAG: diaminopimelate decarboxylase [Alphaproteobacteria bacterium]|nr:diaminopimelate decarboxylase [Alphaproteobacteria bacterium]